MEIAALKVKQQANLVIGNFLEINSLIILLLFCKITSSKMTRKYPSALLKDNYLLFFSQATDFSEAGMGEV